MSLASFFRSSGWSWVPSLYLVQGIPSQLVMSTSLVMFVALGYDAGEVVMWTSLASLPWSLKPLWAPFVECVSTLRRWVVVCQFLMAVAVLALGTLVFSFSSSLWVFVLPLLLVALVSATHDIACDGYYMNALTHSEQSFFVGIRSTFYRVATLAAAGLVPVVADVFLPGSPLSSSLQPLAHWLSGFFGCQSLGVLGWGVAISLSGVLLFVLWAVNARTMPVVVEAKRLQDNGFRILGRAFASFFSHPGVVPFLAFFLLYRLGESWVCKVAPIFFTSSVSQGGLGFSASDYGLIYGTVGTIMLTLGGIIGGVLAARHGLRPLLWPMALFMNLPNLAYVILALHANAGVGIVWAGLVVAVEQFGYGFGFSAYMLALILYVRDSEYKAAEYSIGTALMTLGLVLPGAPAGHAAMSWGYSAVFIIACLATVPGFLAVGTLHRFLTSRQD